MSTDQDTQHRLTSEILALFLPLPDDFCEAEDKSLKVSIDRCVHFYFYLKEWFDPDARPDATEIGDVRIDLASYVEYFDLLLRLA
jgi:hypothetical protein